MGAVIAAPVEASRPATRSVLVVEDDHDLQTIFCATLEAAGYDAVPMGNTIDAFAALVEQPADAVVLDVDLPGASGLVLLDHLAAAYPDTVVVMATARGNRELVADVSARGADGFLHKPVSPRQLLAAVDAALVRRATGDPTAEERISERMIACLVRIASARDRETGHHGGRMSRFCAMLARELGFDEGRALRIQLASLLHDIGKVAIPDSILHKPGPLTTEERALVRTHPQVGWTVLAGFDDKTLRLAAEIARDHHERWDGSGYPRGLAGEEVRFEARIAAVADVFDALTSDRPYRPRLPSEAACAIIADGRGTAFDPSVVDALLLSRDIQKIAQVPRRRPGKRCSAMS